MKQMKGILPLFIIPKIIISYILNEHGRINMQVPEQHYILFVFKNKTRPAVLFLFRKYQLTFRYNVALVNEK